MPKFMSSHTVPVQNRLERGGDGLQGD